MAQLDPEATWRVFCGICNRKSPSCLSPEGAVIEASRRGWQIGDDPEPSLCPRHAQEVARLEGILRK